MYGDIPTVTKCCFCAPLRYGLLVWAYFKLITSILIFGVASRWIIGYILNPFFFKHATFALTTITVVLIILLFDIIFNVVGIVGAHKKNTTFLRLYYRYGIAHAIVFVSWGLLCIVYGFASIQRPYDDSNVWHNVVMFSAAISASMILHCYLLILIRSAILKLKANADFKFENHNDEPACFMQGTTDVQMIKENKEEEK